jgi:hypothetical protein
MAGLAGRRTYTTEQQREPQRLYNTGELTVDEIARGPPLKQHHCLQIPRAGASGPLQVVVEPQLMFWDRRPGC